MGRQIFIVRVHQLKLQKSEVTKNKNSLIWGPHVWRHCFAVRKLFKLPWQPPYVKLWQVLVSGSWNQRIKAARHGPGSDFMRQYPGGFRLHKVIYYYIYDIEIKIKKQMSNFADLSVRLYGVWSNSEVEWFECPLWVWEVRGSNIGRVVPKTWKMVRATSLLDAQHLSGLSISREADFRKWPG